MSSLRLHRGQLFGFSTLESHSYSQYLHTTIIVIVIVVYKYYYYSLPAMNSTIDIIRNRLRKLNISNLISNGILDS